MQKAGVVVQLVRIPACHAGGRGFEPRPLRQNKSPLIFNGLFLFARAVSVQTAHFIGRPLPICAIGVINSAAAVLGQKHCDFRYA